MEKCLFTSDWSDGSEITTPCEYNVKTGEVYPEVSEGCPKGVLIQEYITLKDGKDKKVCPECHKYVLKFSMEDDATGAGIHEEYNCPDCGKVDL